MSGVQIKELRFCCDLSLTCCQVPALFCLSALCIVPPGPARLPPCLQVADVAARLVPATMTLFNRVQARMLPTPAKFHYLFNMRDLSKASGGGGLQTCLERRGESVHVPTAF